MEKKVAVEKIIPVGHYYQRYFL